MHQCLCETCSQLFAPGAACPICRVPCVLVSKVFFG
jgi:hypothetical protein